MNPKQRIAYGRSRRNVVGRTAQGDPGLKRRRFDPLHLLLASAKDRVPELLPIKYARMSVSPFAFFRGAISIMAADLSLRPNSGIEVQLCGDAHVQNMGAFASPEGRLIFDVNDFDETIRGPWEWDVKRMAASIVLAGREASQKHTDCRFAAEAFAEVYSQTMAEFAKQPVLDVARHVVHRGGDSRPIHAALQQSQRTKPLDLLSKYTRSVRGKPRFIDEPTLWHVKGSEAEHVLASLASYREVLSPERRQLFDRFRARDVGFKIVGTGSVGLRDYVVLLEGNGPKDPLFLQIKQEVRSAYAPYMVNGARYQNHGQRVAEGQRAIQPGSDPLLGWTRFSGHDYLVRQLNDHKGSIDLKTLEGGGLENLARLAGELLARGHARSGDACMIHGYCGSASKIVKALGLFASMYADQAEADYAKFMTAIKDGKIKTAKQ